MPSLLRAPTPQTDTPLPSTSPTSAGPAYADPAFGALGLWGMQGTMGNADVLSALPTAARATPKPTVDPVAADRAKAATDLAGRFNVVDNDYKGTKLPNTVTKAEYEKICAAYSDVRLGRGDLTIDASKYTSKKDQDAYKAGALNDIASLLQTESGRGLVYQLGNNATQKDAKGNPIHRHTTLTPLLDSQGKVDKTNGYAAPDGAGGDATVGRDGKLTPGKGTDVTIAYNPGVNVGDAYKEYQAANPWLSGFRSDVILMHEGNHAMQMTAGTGDPRYVQRTDNAANKSDPLMAQDASARISRIEHQAVGVGLYANDPMTENAYRAERRKMADAKAPGLNAGDSTLTPRTSYTPSAPTRAVAPPSADPMGGP